MAVVAVTRVTSRILVTTGGRVVANSWFSVGGPVWPLVLSHWPHSLQATRPEHVHGSMSRKGWIGELAVRVLWNQCGQHTGDHLGWPAAGPGTHPQEM